MKTGTRPAHVLARTVQSIELALGASRVALGACTLASTAIAQVTYSIDWQGPTIGAPDSQAGVPIRESDILRPPLGAPTFGPLANPRMVFTGGVLGINQYPHCNSTTPPCRVELDALAYGNDARFTNVGFAESFAQFLPRPIVWFSVEEWSGGAPAAIAAPNPLSEGGNVGDSGADIFTAFDMPPPPLPPGSVSQPGSTGVFDGDGLFSSSGFAYPGLGLEEPNVPGTPPDDGDNLDALAIGPIPSAGGAVYFSLDASFPDPILGAGANTGSAALQGVPPGAVLVKILGGGPATVYATPAQLGLDLLGPGTDDLDALILAENGVPGYQPSVAPYDWLSGATDMLVFSIRRGSALDLTTNPAFFDSAFGLHIEPGDLLLPPASPGQTPRLWIAAENLGLVTRRSIPMAIWGDELDAAALTNSNCYDCNNNGVEDAVDIAGGTSTDSNDNGIPDECEHHYAIYCNCPPAVAPCGNPDRAAGCDNSTGVGAKLAASGTTSAFTDDLVLTASQMPPYATGFAMRSLSLTQAVFNDGNLCIGPPYFRFGLINADASGVATRGPGLVAVSCTNPNSIGCFVIGVTWHVQVFYRDLTGPCGTGSNLTNGLSITFSQ